MKQLLVLSGKGGTGKTTVTTSLIHISQVKKYADCDVDAPNLHLSMTEIPLKETIAIHGLPKAFIHQDVCINCGLCQKYCRFDAIYLRENEYIVDSMLCEGCSVCTLVCPVDAISMEKNANGLLRNYENEDTFFTTATLNMGSGNSGLLVSEVKNQLKTSTVESSFEIIDGSPGIGCPVISSITGVDLILIVAEPSVSGISDMIRVLEVAKRMNVRAVVSVNKYDVNEEKTYDIINICKERNLVFVGTIPYDPKLIEISNGIFNLDTLNHSIGYESIKHIYENIKSILLGDE